jgi:hypothetical protein
MFGADQFDNYRRLRALIAELEALSLAITDADPRSKRRPRPATTDIPQTTT